MLLSTKDRVSSSEIELEHVVCSHVLTGPSNNFGKFQEEWTVAQSFYEEEDKFISIDCSASQEFCQEHDVASFPTIRLYRQNGHFERYRGPRKAKE